jgi:hypothetical protein
MAKDSPLNYNLQIISVLSDNLNHHFLRINNLKIFEKYDSRRYGSI